MKTDEGGRRHSIPPERAGLLSHGGLENASHKTHPTGASIRKWKEDSIKTLKYWLRPVHVGGKALNQKNL